MARKYRSFRLSERKAEIVVVALTYFIMKTIDAPEFRVHNREAHKILNELQNYEWEIKNNG